MDPNHSLEDQKESELRSSLHKFEYSVVLSQADVEKLAIQQREIFEAYKQMVEDNKDDKQ